MGKHAKTKITRNRNNKPKLDAIGLPQIIERVNASSVKAVASELNMPYITLYHWLAQRAKPKKMVMWCEDEDAQKSA